ncbi:MAG TPA: hypothetical protein PKN64_08510, partial [Casimicrobium sp.]|nr:hypothetical protein [Casimicrobium sp.]
ATQMILDEKLLAAYLPAHSWFDELSGALLTVALLGMFLYAQKKKRSAPSEAIPFKVGAE